ncbi:MAG: hypothetical protein ACRC5T_01960 [Cetobacterium sp.]
MIIKIQDWFYEISRVEGAVELNEIYIKGLLDGINSVYNVVETENDYSWEEYMFDIVLAIKCCLPVGYTVNEVDIQHHFQGSPKLRWGN